MTQLIETPYLTIEIDEMDVNGDTEISVRLVAPDDGHEVFTYKTRVPSRVTTFTAPKSLIVPWLAMGLFSPLGVRTESLIDHGISNVGFMVTPDGLRIAQAYNHLTGLDITEAI